MNTSSCKPGHQILEIMGIRCCYKLIPSLESCNWIQKSGYQTKEVNQQEAREIKGARPEKNQVFKKTNIGNEYRKKLREQQQQ